MRRETFVDDVTGIELHFERDCDVTRIILHRPHTGDVTRIFLQMNCTIVRPILAEIQKYINCESKKYLWRHRQRKQGYRVLGYWHFWFYSVLVPFKLNLSLNIPQTPNLHSWAHSASRVSKRNAKLHKNTRGCYHNIHFLGNLWMGPISLSVCH